MNYTGKNVFISGGTSGIGLAVAKAFLACGANVLAFSIDSQEMFDQALSDMKQAAVSSEQKIKTSRINVVDPKEVEKLLTKEVTDFGTPDVLVNSAGTGGANYFENLTYDVFDKVIQVNLYGTRNTCFTLAPHMKKNGGYIVNVASIGGLIGVFGNTAYSASKFAVVGFSESLRSELKRFGITVSALCPPEVDTPLWHKANVNKPEETKAINRGGGRMKPEEVAESLLAGMENGSLLIIPGRKGQMVHLLKRLVPKAQEFFTDRIIRKVGETES